MAIIGDYLDPRPARASANGMAASATWVEQVSNLSRFDEYATDGWDGGGARAVSTVLLASSAVLAVVLRDRGGPAPVFTLPGVNGTVIFEWQSDGVYEQIEVTCPGQGEYIRVRNHTTEAERLVTWATPAAVALAG